jgi:hypothetical protein
VLKRIRVNEVSPVLMGAGVDTRLLDIKSELKKACPVHSTATDTGSWDAGAAVRRARSGEDKSYYNRIFAWNDPEGDSSVKSSYKFPHHFIHGDGEPGAASTKACIVGIAALNGARGGAAIPDADRKGVWNHLAKHLQDADIEPPELKAIDTRGEQVPLKDAIEILLENCDAVIGRIEEVGELRKAEGRHPAESTMKRIANMEEKLADLLGRIKSLKEEHNEGYKLYMEFLKSEIIRSV